MPKSATDEHGPRKNTEPHGLRARNRRAFLKKAPAIAAAAVVATPVVAKAQGAADKPVKKVFYRNGKPPEKPPLFNGTVLYGNLVFISGIGFLPAGWLFFQQLFKIVEHFVPVLH